MRDMEGNLRQISLYTRSYRERTLGSESRSSNLTQRTQTPWSVRVPDWVDTFPAYARKERGLLFLLIKVGVRVHPETYDNRLKH